MKLLKDRILQDGQCFEGGVLKVDSFINHQMDIPLLDHIIIGDNRYTSFREQKFLI